MDANITTNKTHINNNTEKNYAHTNIQTQPNHQGCREKRENHTCKNIESFSIFDKKRNIHRKYIKHTHTHTYIHKTHNKHIYSDNTHIRA